MTNPIGINFNVHTNAGSTLQTIQALNRAVSVLNANAAKLNTLNVMGVARQIAAPKFNWEPGIRQTDQLVKNIQKGKLSANEFFDVYRNRTNELVNHQARLARSTAVPLGNGAMAMTIPASKDMSRLTTAAEMANRRLSVQSEIIHGLGQRVQDWGKNTQWAGRQMMVGMTVPFAMGAAAAAMYANKIDAAMVRVEKVVDEPLEGFRDKAMATAKEVTQTMGLTVESTLEVMSELAAAGKSGPELQRVTKLSQALATLGDMDQQSAIKGMISIQQIWKMSTDELSKSVDYLNYVEDQTPTKLKDLVDSIPIAGVQVAQLGGTLQDTTILLTAFREKGIETVEGANAIKTAMNRILSPTRGASETFKELTGKDLPALVKSTGGKPLETFQALSDVIMGGNIQLSDQQRIISKLVGTYQSSRITALMSGLQTEGGAVSKAREISEESPEKWAARTAKAMSAITNSASGQWKIAIESFKLEFIETGNMILSIATKIVKAATTVFSIFNDLPDLVKGGLLVGAGIMAIAGPITMIVGILANFVGTLGKVFAVLNGSRGKYKSLTIEEKAAELAAGQLNTKMLTQAETAQILVFQMDKLRASYLETTGAAKTAAAAMSMPALPSGGVWSSMGQYAASKSNRGLTMPIGGLPIPGQGSPLLGTNAWSAKTDALLSNSGKNMEKIAEQSERAGRFQKVFNSEVLIGVGAAAGLLGMTTDTNSAMSDWLNYISLGAVALGAILPLVGGIGDKIKGWAAASAATNMAGAWGNAAKGFGSKLLDTGKTALKGLSSFIMGPWGIGIAAGLVGIWGITKLIGAAQEEQNRHQTAMVTSTDTWMKILGKTKAEWGQIRDESGAVKDNVDSIAQKMREEMPDVVNEFSGAGPRYLEILTEREVLKLQGQGLKKDEILYNMGALLQAAGRTRKEIDEVLGDIKVKFDFANGEKDLKAFLDNTSNDVQSEMNRWMFEMPTSTRAGGGNYAEERSEQQDQTAERMKGLFMDRLAGLDPAEKAIFANNFANTMNKTFEQAFDKLEKDHGSDIAKNWKEAKAKFFNWDADENKWVADRGATNKAGLRETEVDQMEIQIDTEQRLTQAIARGMKIDEERVKKMSIISDILPYVADGNISAKEAQEAYNRAVKQAKDNGDEMTEGEKKKLAQLMATQFGLSSAALMNNSYADSGMKVVGTIDAQKRAMQDFMGEMKNFGPAIEDFWESTAAGPEGFVDALGGDPAAQAQQLTEQVKGIYSGAMGDIYSAMADQAQDQWEARLDAISAGFEARKEAVQRQIEASDKAYEAKQDAFQDRWDARMEASQDAFEARQEAIENEAEAQLDSIQNQIDAEQEREDARQRQFEAEEKRIERLTELANRTIDYNRALATGDIDEAARVMNNTESIQGSWAGEDARDASTLLSKKQIDDLNARKELVDRQKQLKLDALREEEEATSKSLQRQRDMEQKSMEKSRDIERARLQGKLDGLSREQASAERTERAKQEMNRRTLEIELATLKAFVPRNEAELAAHVQRISSAYSAYGLNLQTTGGYWGQIIGNALSNNVNKARQDMSNTAAWSAFGSSVAGAISKGAFGLSLKDFFTLIATGQPPAGWTPPGVAPAAGGGGTFAQRPGGRMFYHTGGEVGTGFSTQGRPGRGQSPLGGDEVPAVLQKGEFVFPRSAVQLYGSEYLKKMSAGAPAPQPATIGPAGMFGSLMGAMGHSIIGLAMNRLMEYASAAWASPEDPGGPLGPGIGLGSSNENSVSLLLQLAKRFYPGAVVTSGLRFTDNGHHSRGMAADFGMNGNKGLPNVRKIAAGFMGASGSLLELIHSTGPGYFVKNGKVGNIYGPKTTAEHADHVHVAARKDAVQALLNGSPLGGAGAPGAIASNDVQRRVQAVAARYGWGGGAQWNALSALIQGESSWNPNAANPTSSARGLFQKMTSIHGPIEPTVEGQAQWGLNYIRGKYGSPATAYAKWSSRSPHWYDSGGDVPPGHFAGYNGTNQTESMLTHSRTGQVIKALEISNIAYRQLMAQPKSLVPSLNGVAGPAGATYNEEINVNINGTNLNENELKRMVTSAIDDARIKQLKRRGQVK